MPGGVPRTSTLALTNATLPYALTLANQGMEAVRGGRGAHEGVNVVEGTVTYPASPRPSAWSALPGRHPQAWG
jgi:alanine dehydrogenase